MRGYTSAVILKTPEKSHCPNLRGVWHAHCRLFALKTLFSFYATYKTIGGVCRLKWAHLRAKDASFGGQKSSGFSFIHFGLISGWKNAWKNDFSGNCVCNRRKIVRDPVLVAPMAISVPDAFRTQQTRQKTQITWSPRVFGLRC